MRWKLASQLQWWSRSPHALKVAVATIAILSGLLAVMALLVTLLHLDVLVLRLGPSP